MNRRSFLRFAAVAPLAGGTALTQPATTWGQGIPAILAEWERIAPQPLRMTMSGPFISRASLQRISSDVAMRAEFQRRYIDPVVGAKA